MCGAAIAYPGDRRAELRLHPRDTFGCHLRGRPMCGRRSDIPSVNTVYFCHAFRLAKGFKRSFGPRGRVPKTKKVRPLIDRTFFFAASADALDLGLTIVIAGRACHRRSDSQLRDADAHEPDGKPEHKHDRDCLHRGGLLSWLRCRMMVRDRGSIVSLCYRMLLTPSAPHPQPTTFRSVHRRQRLAEARLSIRGCSEELAA